MNDDLKDFHVWRSFNFEFQESMKLPENWYVFTKCTYSPKEMVRAFGLPVPCNQYFMLSSGCLGIKINFYF